MSFNNVFPGKAWQPEPAERYNAVNDLLRNTENSANIPGGGLPNNIIMGYVPENISIPEFSPVSLIKMHSLPGEEILNGQCCMEIGIPGISLYIDDYQYPFGVALAYGKKNSFIPVQIYGSVAFPRSRYGGFNFEKIKTGSPLVPQKNSWIEPNDDSQLCATVLVPPRNGNSTVDYGIISLAPLFTFSFTGTFKLIAIDDNNFKVVNGINHEDEYCGEIISSGTAGFPLKIKSETFSGNGRVYVKVHYKRIYNENSGEYSVTYSAFLSRSSTTVYPYQTDEGDFFALDIGSFSNGVCYQHHKDGNINLRDYGWYL